MKKEEFVQAFTEFAPEEQSAILEELRGEKAVESSDAGAATDCCSSMLEKMPEAMAEMMSSMMAAASGKTKEGDADAGREAMMKMCGQMTQGCGCGA